MSDGRPFPLEATLAAAPDPAIKSLATEMHGARTDMATLAGALDRIVDLAEAGEVRAVVDRLEELLVAQDEQPAVTPRDATHALELLDWVLAEDESGLNTAAAWAAFVRVRISRLRDNVERVSRDAKSREKNGAYIQQLEFLIEDLTPLQKALEGFAGWYEFRLDRLRAERQSWLDLYRAQIEAYRRERAAAAVRRQE
jgi:hypothetical protein